MNIPHMEFTADGLVVFYSNKEGTDRIMKDKENFYYIGQYVITKLSPYDARHIIEIWKSQR